MKLLSHRVQGKRRQPAKRLLKATLMIDQEASGGRIASLEFDFSDDLESSLVECGLVKSNEQMQDGN